MSVLDKIRAAKDPHHHGGEGVAMINLHKARSGQQKTFLLKWPLADVEALDKAVHDTPVPVVGRMPGRAMFLLWVWRLFQQFSPVGEAGSLRDSERVLGGLVRQAPYDRGGFLAWVSPMKFNESLYGNTFEDADRVLEAHVLRMRREAIERWSK